jgi:hypothetical protein
MATAWRSTQLAVKLVIEAQELLVQKRCEVESRI